MQEVQTLEQDIVEGGVEETVEEPTHSLPPPLIHSDCRIESDTSKKNYTVYKFTHCNFFLIATTKTTGPVIKNCETCSQRFRTYIPNSDCIMPDGMSFCYREPQNECPE